VYFCWCCFHTQQFATVHIQTYTQINYDVTCWPIQHTVYLQHGGDNYCGHCCPCNWSVCTLVENGNNILTYALFLSRMRLLEWKKAEMRNMGAGGRKSIEKRTNPIEKSLILSLIGRPAFCTSLTHRNRKSLSPTSSTVCRLCPVRSTLCNAWENCTQIDR